MTGLSLPELSDSAAIADALGRHCLELDAGEVTRALAIFTEDCTTGQIMFDLRGDDGSTVSHGASSHRRLDESPSTPVQRRASNG